MNRSLIVAKVGPDTEKRIAEIFAESDATELPRLAGVRHRSLYRLGDLYVHLLE
ncbi:polyketide synthesis cyclase, partial [Micromonospora sp. ATCC 39149]